MVTLVVCDTILYTAVMTYFFTVQPEQINNLTEVQKRGRGFLVIVTVGVVSLIKCLMLWKVLM